MTRGRPGGAGERENGDASLLESTIDSFHQASRTLSANFSAAAGWMQGSGASHLLAERGASEGGADGDDGHGSGMQEGGGDGGNELVLGGAEPVALDVLEREFELTYIHSYIHSYYRHFRQGFCFFSRVFRGQLRGGSRRSDVFGGWGGPRFSVKISRAGNLV